jgi:fatty-acyl-CoA synthase
MADETVLPQGVASFECLTPLSFLKRSSLVYPDHVALVDGEVQVTYLEFLERATRLSGALIGMGVRRGERVGVLANNGRMALEAHFGVPMAGAVLVPLNVHLKASELQWIIEDSGMSALLVESSLARGVDEVLAGARDRVRIVEAGEPASEYEALLASSSRQTRPVVDERSAISINYTSGTGGAPRGVLAHHRGAYLQALAMVIHFRLDRDSGYLWTLPLYHCNGWCMAWGVAAAGGTSICTPGDARSVWQELHSGRVSHFCAAPSLLMQLMQHPDSEAGALGTPVQVGVGGAPPPERLLARTSELGLVVSHLYGLTESFGPAVVCERRPRSEQPSLSETAHLARQGVLNVVGGELRVLSQNGDDVPADGLTQGEVVLRGNTVMTGYLRGNDSAAEPFVDGWFHTGDLAVMHSDGYIEIRDRAKDVFKFSGEAISPAEIENVLDRHPAVLEAAVVGLPAGQWGELPVAFVQVRDGATVSAAELRGFLATKLSDYKVPKRVIFAPLPKTATGKVQRHLLRAQLATKH